MMTVHSVRGYCILHVAKFLELHYDQATCEHTTRQLSQGLKSELQTLKPSNWYPREHLSELLSAIAAINDDSSSSALDLAACGEFLHLRMANQFVKLAMGLLTPSTFIRKLPLFWNRDHRGCGRCDVVVPGTPGQAQVDLVGVAGYDHIGPLWLGWIRAGLGSLGSENAEVTQTGWALPSPGSNHITYKVRWS